MITVPMHCNYGYQYYNGQCRRVFSFIPTSRPGVFLDDAQLSPKIQPAEEGAMEAIIHEAQKEQQQD